MPKSKAFLKLKKALTQEYLGDKVPKRFQSRYGKTYGKKDIESFSYAVAKSRGIPF